MAALMDDRRGKVYQLDLRSSAFIFANQVAQVQIVVQYASRVHRLDGSCDASDQLACEGLLYQAWATVFKHQEDHSAAMQSAAAQAGRHSLCSAK